jgi:amidohydrolase
MVRQMDEMWRRIYPQVVEWRRHLHQYPELSFQEKRTPLFIADKLSRWGIDVRTGVGGAGVVGRLKGTKPGPAVALRADMDALPIQDGKSCEYRSKVPGVMHACGHDGHTAALLGVARTLSEFRRDLAGEVVFLFQHAEEVSPGGAKAMIEDGALDGVDVIYGVHLWTPFPVGEVRTAPGPVMAAADEFVVEISGKGGHGGLPHQTIDSIVVGAHLVVNLQSIVSRQVNPLEPGVISVGMFQAGSGFNVIAERAVIKGTVRAFREETRLQLKERLETMAKTTCSMFGAEMKFDYRMGYPPVVNDPAETSRALQTAERLFGERAGKCEPLMAGEDFSYYLQRVPGCFLFVGAGNPRAGIVYPHHHPCFDIDEQALDTAGRLLIELAVGYGNGR